ncbi:helix-turn-helix domain-containing protein [Phytohabitans sp. LJ34]|uniref:helix-turn-helix domain-containing protein n=1 Tax=Phytohabitans sp. LJ34 TaxID=3452217 RepID=UPI003F89387C
MRYFSLSGEDPSSRVDILDEAARHCSVAFRARPADPGRAVSFEHLDRYFGGVNVTETTLDNFQGFRSAKLARRDPTPRLVVTLSSGPYTIEQNDRLDRRRSGSMVAYWSRDPLRLQADVPVRARSVTVTMEELGLPYLFLRGVMVRDIGGSPLGQMVATYLAELATLPPLSEAEAASLAYPTIELLRALLTSAGGERGGHLGQTIGMRIMLHLRAAAGDPELSADTIAAHFGISKRYLYAVLARMDVSLGDWIRTERLGRAAGELTDPANARVSIAAIGRRCGFSDHSTFSRAFKRRYGHSPSEWRRLTEAERETGDRLSGRPGRPHLLLPQSDVLDR